MHSVLFSLMITFVVIAKFCHSVSGDASSKGMTGVPGAGVPCKTKHQCLGGLRCKLVSKTCGGICNTEYTKYHPANKPKGSKCQNNNECNDGFSCKDPSEKRCGGTCDVNECSTGKNDCHENADCKNTIGSFICTCKQGYTGDGKKCRPMLVDSCLALYKEGKHSNGVYQLSPDSKTVFSAYCDMENGGWTLIQRRVDASANFTRDWDEYENGFGDLSGNFWLGLKYIHLLTSTPVDISSIINRRK